MTFLLFTYLLLLFLGKDTWISVRESPSTTCLLMISICSTFPGDKDGEVENSWQILSSAKLHCWVELSTEFRQQHVEVRHEMEPSHTFAFQDACSICIPVLSHHGHSKKTTSSCKLSAIWMPSFIKINSNDFALCYHCYKTGQSCYNAWKLVFNNHGAMAPSGDKNMHQQVRWCWLCTQVLRLPPCNVGVFACI